MSVLMLAMGLSNPAAMMELQPVADTAIHGVSPGNNMGGHAHVAMGATAKDTAARGLFRFDLVAIPTNAAVSAVTMTFNLPRLNRPDLTNTMYATHRMLREWGEGTKQGNLGSAATAGEASWNHSALPVSWGAPGGQAGVDYVMAASAMDRMGPSPGVYTMASTAGLVADVQQWIAHPGENFGWLLKAEDESVLQTARQFASRETTNAPVLRIEYSVGPVAELRITGIVRVETNVVIRWMGGRGSVAVERAVEVRGTWEEVGESAGGVATNVMQELRSFYRLRN